MLLPVAPNVLDRIQFRRIGGEVLHPQSPALFGKKIASELAFVGRQAVPDDQQRSGNVTQQGLQKVHHLRALDGALLQSEIEVEESDSGGCRDRVPVEVVLQNGSLAARRPSPHAMRSLAYPAFVDEDDRAPFFFGFFFISGQPTRRQRRISSSFLSRARPTGR